MMTITTAGRRILRLTVSALALALSATSGIAQSGPTLVPHKAIYDLVVTGSGEENGISSGSGRIVFEFTRERCTGFSLHYRQAMALDNPAGGSNLIDFRSNTFEADDGASFSFSSKTKYNDADEEAISGSARREADPAIALSIEEPEESQSRVTGNILFPTTHLREMLGAARAGRTFFDAVIYDGADPVSDPTYTLTVIGAPLTGDTGLEPSLISAGYGAITRWPIAISYYDAVPGGEGEQTPRFSYALEIFENGVGRNLRLDYGTFQVSGRLAGFEPLEAACP